MPKDNKQIYFRLRVGNHRDDDILQAFTTDGQGPRYIDFIEINKALQEGARVVTMPLKEYLLLEERGLNQGRKQLEQLGNGQGTVGESEAAKLIGIYRKDLELQASKSTLTEIERMLEFRSDNARKGDEEISVSLGALRVIARHAESLSNDYLTMPSVQSELFTYPDTGDKANVTVEHIIFRHPSPSKGIVSPKVEDVDGTDEKFVFSRVNSVMNGSHVAWDNDFNSKDYGAMLDSFIKHSEKVFNQEDSFYYNSVTGADDSSVEIMAKNDNGIMTYNHDTGEYEYYAKFSKAEVMEDIKLNGLSPFASEDLRTIILELRAAQQVALFQMASCKPAYTLNYQEIEQLELESLVGKKFNVRLNSIDENVITIGGVTADGKALAFLDNDHTASQAIELTKDAFRSIAMSYNDVMQIREREINSELQHKDIPPRQYSKEEFLDKNILSDGRKVDKYLVYRDHRTESPTYNQWRFYAEVGDMKMSRSISDDTCKAFLDRYTTPGELAEKCFGEQLHLASFYSQFRFPEGANVEKTLLIRDKSCIWHVQADLGEYGLTSRHQLSWNDRQALFKDKTATKEQLAARYLNEEIKDLLTIEKKQMKSHATSQDNIENLNGQTAPMYNHQNPSTMSKKKQQVKQEEASVKQNNNAGQEKTASKGQKAKVPQGKENGQKPQVKEPRPPQMVTVNGEKVSHAHAFQSNKNPEDWFFTAKIDGVAMRPRHMRAEDVKAWQDRKWDVEAFMRTYYPTKLQQKVTKDEYMAANELSDGRKIDKMAVYKEKDEQRPDFGKYHIYVQVANVKMSKVMTNDDLNAYFDRVTTPAKLVEKNFGEELNLRSAYEKYQLPQEAQGAKVNIRKDITGNWHVSVDMGDKGQTSKHQLSRNDLYSLFSTKTATKEQLAAKYCNDEIHSMASKVAVERKQGVKY